MNNLYVVNMFSGGAITDYGNYSDIRNITTSEKLNQDGDKITINTDADKFYYQGTLEKKELPWNIDIKYFLDGKEIPGSSLAGKSGKLKITVSVKQNDKVSSTFFDNYALQIGLSLDNKLCSDIEADNATAAEAGSKKQLTYTVLPGKGADITVTADVHDFEMEAMTINGIKLSLGLTADSDEFMGQILELTDAIKGLDDGAGDLLSGTEQFKSSSSAIALSANELYNAAADLNMGIKKLRDGLASYNPILLKLI